MADTPLKSLVFPGLSDRYTIPQGVSEVTIANSGAVSWAINAGVIYHFTGTLTSLTISFNAAPDVAHYHFDFNTGSTVPTITLPAGVVLPDNNAFVANTHYEVDILNNYATVMGWTLA